tara:strand:+ start:587 stop:859 length:273 start_codon:yes stop_codon:yes gene_type:complete
MLISKAQRDELIEAQPKTKYQMLRWVLRNSNSVHHTWEALAEMDETAFFNLQEIVKLVAEERNGTKGEDWCQACEDGTCSEITFTDEMQS